MPEIDRASTEYVLVPVVAIGADPLTAGVDMAFTAPRRRPADADWFAADWEVIDEQTHARILVGPAGAVTLAPGRYDVWVRITDTPERPIKQAVGVLEVT